MTALAEADAVATPLLDALAAILGAGGVVRGADLERRDPGLFMPPSQAVAVLRPTTTEQISRLLTLCNEHGQPVVIQGGMSGWVRGTQTRSGDLVLSLERMNAIECLDPVNRTATVQAGVILQALHDAAEAESLCFPVDLGGRGSCQVGGNAATNAGGIQVVRYGMMREQILGLEVVLADGRIISSMNQMIKNNAGYDLKHLFIGSEGTLGVITRLVLRLRERPTSTSTALASAQSFDRLTRLFRHMDAALGGTLTAFELIDNAFYRVNTEQGRHAPPLPRDRPFYAIVEANGADHSHDREVFERALTQAIELELIDDAVLAGSERERREIWDVREDLEHVVRDFQPFYAFDVSLPLADMVDYMEAVKARLASDWPGAAVAFLGHMGDGNLHVAVGAGGAEDRHGVEACVYEPLRRIGGSVSAEHGIGLEKKAWLDISRNAAERDLMVQIKAMLDPRNILNPGKVLDGIAST